MRIGIGYDVHRLVPERDLTIGGVKIPYEKGLLGHSDADVLLHAIMDALLGAAALGDIGKHFPDNDPAYEGISSLVLLEKTGVLLEQKGRTVSRDTLMRKLWETDSFVDENTLTVNMTRLRRKLEGLGLTEFIRTRKGLGYQIE